MQKITITAVDVLITYLFKCQIQELEERIVTLKNFYESRWTIPSITTDASQSPEITPPVLIKMGNITILWYVLLPHKKFSK